MTNENFYKLCQSLGIIDQLIESGFMLDPKTISNRGAEQLIKANLVDTPTFADKFREKFSKNNLGVAGKKGDPHSIVNKLKRFVVQYEYPEETILKAVDAYLMENQMKPQYIMKASNFVFKRQGFKDEEISELAVWCDEVDNDDSPTIKSAFYDG